MALLVLGDLGVGIGRCRPHRDGHLRQPRKTCSAKALGAEVAAVAPFGICRLHDDRLQDPVLADVLG